MRTVLKAAGVVAHIAARIKAKPHLVQLPPKLLHLPCNQILQHKAMQAQFGNLEGKRQCASFCPSIEWNHSVVNSGFETP